jgi:hypothetical protein
MSSCRSAKKPPVIAPSIMTGSRGDPSLMRQFQGGASTGSPLRREARSRNPSGSSAAPRNRDIIEEEDVDMDDGEGLMMQARTNVRMAPTSPSRMQTRRALSPARGYQVNGMPTSSMGSQEGTKSSSSSQKPRSKALYDRITRNIDLAFDAREQNLPITASGTCAPLRSSRS